jgi:alpha-D-ribose 1-methylphosphonate 5-triphosphate synthase subunit PhnH
MSVALAEISRGFHDPIHGAQRTFRALLDAMARPGNERELQLADLDGLEPPASATPGRPLGAGPTAALLTLLDAEATVRWRGLARERRCARLPALSHRVRGRPRWKSRPRSPSPAAPTWTRGCAAAWTSAPTRRPSAAPPCWWRWTSWARVPAAHASCCRVRAFPSARVLTVSGLSRDFWRWRIDLQPQLPRGIDLVLVCGARIAAIPRSTRITLAG